MFDTSSGKTVDILSDSGSSVSACHPSHFPHVPIESGAVKRYRSAQGKLLKFYGYKTVRLVKDNQTVTIRFTLLDVTRPILSVSSSMNQSSTVTHYEKNNSYMSRKTKDEATKRLGLTYRVGLFFLRAVVASGAFCPASQGQKVGSWWGSPPGGGYGHYLSQVKSQYLAPLETDGEHKCGVDEAQSVPDVPEAVMLPGPREPTAEERAYHNLMHADFQPWCIHCLAGRAKEDPHRKVETIADNAAKIQVDYFYPK